MAARFDRLVLLGLDGATYDVLAPLAEVGVMPNVARLMADSALLELASTQPCITPVAWTSFQTGADPQHHGIWDFRRLETAPARLELNDARRIGRPTLLEIVERQAGPIVSLHLPMTYPSRCRPESLIVGGLEAPSGEAALEAAPRLRERLRREGIQLSIEPIWRRRPASIDELEACVQATQRDFEQRTRAARVADSLVDWRLLFVQFQALDNLQHRAWHLLGLDGGARTGAWARTTHEALRTLDCCVGRLLELADQRGAAVMLCSDHGFGRFRGKISLPHLLERRGLVRPGEGRARLEYRAARCLWKLGRWAAWHRGSHAARGSRPLQALAPIDWRRSRVVAAHGNLAALLYLNSTDRFGGGPLRTASHRDQTIADALAALGEARHPLTGEPLFVDAWSMAQRFDVDPVAAGIPDVVGIPADGFHTRHKFGPSGQLVLDDPDLTGTHRRAGVWIVAGRGIGPRTRRTAQLRDVAPTALDMLGLAIPDSMTGRSRWAQIRGAAPADAGVRCGSRHGEGELPPYDVGPESTLTEAERAAVERRLIQLGYLD